MITMPFGYGVLRIELVLGAKMVKDEFLVLSRASCQWELSVQQARRHEGMKLFGIVHQQFPGLGGDRALAISCFTSHTMPIN